MLQNMNSPEGKENIMKRLEKLNKWQDEQKKLLQERQNMQRKMLGMEQMKMYEILGLLPENNGHSENNNRQQSEEHQETAVKVVAEDTDEGNAQATTTSRTENKITPVYGKDDVHIEAVASEHKQKRIYLRRGEGLKQRFKIDPSAFRLNNLPRYKYAKAHAHLFTNNSKTTQRKLTKPQANQLQADDLDAQERRFQHTLMSSNNICNSTPDVKSANSGVALSQPVRHKNSVVEEAIIKQHLRENTPPSDAPSEMPPVSWAKVLDTQLIKPILVQQMRNPFKNAASFAEDPDDNLSIFELLEQKANEGTIDMNSSCIQRFMQKKLKHKNEESDEIPLETNLQHVGLLPNVALSNSMGLCDTEDDDDEDEDENNGVTSRTDTEYDSTLTPERRMQNSNKPKVQVRFCETNDTHEYQLSTDSSTVVGDESSSLDMFQQFKDALFSALQNKDYAKDSNNSTVSTNPNESSVCQTAMENANPVLSADLQEKMQLIKTRLAELEKEISTFKENNIHLIKAKQEHEIQKAHFAQERLEAVDKFNDEKIQMEIYFHDERMKIEEEKRKFERQMQMQKSSFNSKDRKEIARLKQELDEMQTQLKQKEQAHVAAQARLRAQIRTLEKDQKQLYDDIERISKENKRLQNENLKISRECNNKMLQEINRNIAKLAPKLTPIPYNEGSMFPEDEAHTHIPSSKSNKLKKHKYPQKTKTQHSHRNKTSPCKFPDGNTSSECDERKHHTRNDCGDHTDNFDDKDNEDEISKKWHKSQKQKTKPTDNNKSEEIKANDTANEFKREMVNADGSKDIWYPNGNLKKIAADGMSIRMLYFNKDIKETNINEGTVKYYYAETNTWHTTYLDGMEILEFPNGQTEHRYKNGIVEVHFPDNSIKVINPSDEHKLEEWRFADGTNLVGMRNGDKILMLPNGQKEIQTKLNKRREYPDGTVKIVYPDGSQETRYSNGRVRLKDKDGKLVMDSGSAT